MALITANTHLGPVHGILEDCTRHTVNRILSQFDLDKGRYQWEGMGE